MLHAHLMRTQVLCEHMMNAPSIEAMLSRKNRDEDMYPIARRLDRLPVLGAFARAWVRATRTEEPRALWASLPPLAAT